MGQTKKQDWLAAGLRILGEAGINGLTIQRLTDALGVTKGSFYHHFQNVRVFKKQLIQHWADQYLTTAGKPLEGAGDSLQLLNLIMAKAFTPITEPEMAIRIWAQQDDMVRSLVEQVDHIRREFVFEVFQEATQNDQQASLMADMWFTISIGSITALPRLPAERVLELYQEFKRLYQLENRE